MFNLISPRIARRARVRHRWHSKAAEMAAALVFRSGGVISLLRDQPGSGSHVAIWSAGRRLGTFSVPAITGNETLSFLGVDFGSAIVSRVRITSGNLTLGPGNNESGSQDLVVMDDFI